MGFRDRFRRRESEADPLPLAEPTAPPAQPRTDLAPPASGTPPQPPSTIGPTWLQPYTLRASDHEISVVGEARYQVHLESCSGGRTETGARMPLVTAELIAEPDNPYDRNAIRVDVGGGCVGYIAREETGRFHPVLRSLSAEGRRATCRAWLTGGWDRGGDDRGNFGIVLCLHPNLETIAGPAPMLPFGRGRVSLVGEEKCQEHLAALVNRAARAEVIAALEDVDGAIVATVDGQPIGQLTSKMGDRYRPLLEEVRAAGCTDLTCEARVIRGDKKVDAFLKLSTPWAASSWPTSREADRPTDRDRRAVGGRKSSLRSTAGA